jgi:NADPH-dependent ferric siderophore reductase
VSARDLLDDVLAKLLLRELKISSVRDVSPGFRLLELHGPTLVGAKWSPGDKLQILLSTGSRTYTPFAFDRKTGTLSLLVFVHGDTPGASWGRNARFGDKVRVFGPRGSINLQELASPVTLFGDETSFAVAKALRDSRQSGCAFVFEVGEPAIATEVLTALGIEGAHLVVRRDQDAHLVEVEERLAREAARASASLVLTGRAPAIQKLRGGLKTRRLTVQESKAYWAPGKRGLD